MIRFSFKLTFFLFASYLVLSCDFSGKTKQRQQAEDSAEVFLYVGSYTKKEAHVNGQGKGVYLMKMNESTGKLYMKGIVSAIVNPSFVALSGDQKNLYAVSEIGPSDGTNGWVYSFEVKPDRSLKLLNRQSTAGYAPCYVSSDATGKYVFVTNYAGGIAAMYKRQKDGSLGAICDTIVLKNKKPGVESNPHSIVVSPDNRHVYICDKGADRIYAFAIDFSNDRLLPLSNAYLELPQGDGPRHLTFHPNEKYAYVVNELSNTVCALSYHKEDGVMTLLKEYSTLSVGDTLESYAADIHIHPNGKFLYASNRGDNSIVAYRIDEKTGLLTEINIETTEGTYPRNFAIAPGGKFLYAANQNSGTISHLTINSETGELQSLHFVTEVNTPVCIDFMAK